MDLTGSDPNDRLHIAWPALTPLPSSTNATYKQRSQNNQNHQHIAARPQHTAVVQSVQEPHEEYPDYVTAFTTKVRSTAQSLHVNSGPGTTGKVPSASSSTNPTSKRLRQEIPVALPSESYIRPYHQNITRWNAASSDYVPVPIDLTWEYMERMEQLLHDPTELEPHGYVFKAISREELVRKSQRCKRCLRSLASRGQVGKGSDFSKKPQQTGNSITDLADQFPTLDVHGTANRNKESLTSPISRSDSAIGKQAKVEPKPKPMVCKFHPGMVLRGVSKLWWPIYMWSYANFFKFPRVWSCCNSNPGAPPCSGSDEHLPMVFAPGEIKRNWTFHPTPPYTYNQPGVVSGHCYAVAIDCEMGMSVAGESELIRVTVVDHILGIVLLDSLVWPDAPMQHYNTRFTGIITKDMHEARRNRTCLMGREAARKAVWQFVGPQTIVCVHSGQNDFTTLRWIHHRIIDTFLLEPVPVTAIGGAPSQEVEANDEEPAAEHGHTEVTESADTAVKGQEPPKQKKNKGSGARSLQTLARVKLGRDIQIKEHDSIEDAVATRDLVHWAVMNGSSSGVATSEAEVDGFSSG